MDPGDQSKTALGDVDFVALAAGQTVGRYEIVATLGQGSFGITYRARDTRLGRDVAIKEYLPSALAIRHEGATVLPRSTKVADDFSWGRDRFVAEGQTLASLQNAPAIVRVFDYLEANGTAYIVMQLLSGDTLESHLRQRDKLTPQEVDRILWPLLDGLEQVHNAGFLHRDIKPGNILLDGEGNPTLIDFGASRAAMAGRTLAMTAIFTPGYAAAEQFTSARLGAWTDIYGLSATLYQAITGKVPPSAFERMLQDDYEPLAALRPRGFAPGLLFGLDAGLIVRAGERPQSIATWRKVLAQAGTDAATMVLPQSRPPVLATAASVHPVEPKPVFAWKKATLWAAASVAALSIAAGGGYWALAPSKAPVATVLDPVAERARIEQEVQRARAALAAAEQAAQRQADEEAKQAAEAEAKRKAEAEAAEKLRAEEETRRQAAAQSERQRAEAEAARKKAEADEATRRQAEDDEARRKADAEAADRARIQQEIQKARDALAAAEAARRQAEEEAANLRAQAEAAAAAAEKKRLEDEARQKADAEAKQKADADAAAKQKADAEAAAKQRADAEAAARQKADAEAAAMAKQRADELAAAETARKKAEEEAATLRAQMAAATTAAEKKRLEDEARQKGDDAAKLKVDAETAATAKQKADADAAAAAKQKADGEAAAKSSKEGEIDAKAAEAAETALRLTVADRQRLQVALTSLGFDTRGADGAFGPRTREMIANWQRKKNQPASGFLNAAQRQALLKDGASAIARYDEEQKKIELEKKKLEDEAKARAAQQPPATPAPAAAPAASASAAPQPVATAPQPGTPRDGLWFGALDCKSAGRSSVQGSVSNGAGTLSGGAIVMRIQISGENVSISIRPSGEGNNLMNTPSGVRAAVTGQLSGKLTGRGVYGQGSVGGETCTVSLVGP